MAKITSALALFLFITLVGHTVASVMMVRREATEAEAPTEAAVAADTKASEEETPNETEAAPAAEETEVGEPAAEETEPEGEAAEETEKTEGETEEGKEESPEEGKEEPSEEGKEESAEGGKEGPTEEGEEGLPNESGDLFPGTGFQTGLVFGSPFATLRQMQEYFFQLERALHQIFENTLNEAAEDPDMNNTSTSEEVTIGGHKYLVNRTTIKGDEDNSSVLIRTISVAPLEERRKRAVMQLV